VQPYVWLSLAVVWLWLPPQASAQGALSRVAVSAGWLALAIAHGYAAGVVTPIGVLAILAFGLVCYGYSRQRLTRSASSVTANAPRHGARAVYAAALVATVVFSLALMAHVAPGFSNVLVVKDAVLSPGAAPYTLFLNFDKAQIGLFLLAFGPPLLSSRAAWMTMILAALPRTIVVIAVLMVCALSIGQVRPDVKLPDILPVWAWSNLLFTCTAEEALFRGVVQRQLQYRLGETTGGTAAALAAAGILFGAAHYAGGARAIVLATIAGIGYGWVFWRTNRIEASILSHFLLNAAHILFFTYPARA